MANDAPDAIDRAIAAAARRHRAYVSRQELLDIGLGPQAIKYRVRVGRLIVEYAGVYAVGHRPLSPVDRAAGAVLACGPGAALSHGSAMSLWGFFKRWADPFEVLAPNLRRRRGIRVHRSTTLTRRDITTQLGVRVTTPARTLLDIAPRLSDKTLTRTVNDARLSNYLRLPDLRDVLDRNPRHPGSSRLRPFVEDPQNPTRSEFEDFFPPFCKRYGLPAPQLNAIIGGCEVDAVFPAEGLIVELDGWATHSSKNAFIDDRERDAENLVAGRPTYRITFERLIETPDKEAKRLHAILARLRGH